MDKLMDRLLEDLTGIEGEWLGGVKPFFIDLYAKASSDDVTETDFQAALVRASERLPLVAWDLIGTDGLAEAMEKYMGAAAANGAIAGGMRRRGGKNQRLLTSSPTKEGSL